MSTFIVECDPRDLGARRPRHGRRGRRAAAICEQVFADTLRRASARLQQVDLAQLSLGVERALVVPQLRADRRCAAHRALLDRLGHAARHRGCAGARQGAGGGAGRPRGGRSRATRRAGGRSSRSWSRHRAESAAWYERFAEHMRLAPLDLAMSYITPLGPHRRRPPAGDVAAVHGALRCARRMTEAGMSARQPHRTMPVPRDAPGAREIGFSVPERYNASAILFDNLAAGRGERCAVTGPAGTRTYAELAADAARIRRRAAVARAAARRPRAAVPRRHAGLSGGAVRRDPRGARAAADQHADAAGSAAVLSRRFRRRRLPSAMPPSPTGSMPTACDGTQLEHAGGRQRRRRGARPGGDAAAARMARRGRRAGARARRHAPRRHGVLDVLLGLDGPAQGHRAPAARHGLHARSPTRATCWS